MNRSSVRKAGILVSLLSLIGFSASAALAQTAMPEKSVRFIIGFGPGGGYDTYSRLIARHIGNYLPGKPSVIPQNMPGASSVRAAQYLFSKAPKDGTAIGMVDQGIYLAQQLGQSKIDFDLRKFNWVGRLTNNTPVIFTWHQSSIKNLNDFLNKKVVLFGAASASLDYAFLSRAMGAKIQTIRSYKSSREAGLAMQRGEIDGLEMPWPVVLTNYGDFVKEKKIIPIVQAGNEKHESLPDVPRMIDIAKTDRERNLFEFIAGASGIGRSVIAPPDLSPDVLATLRRGFADAVKDPKFRADAERTKLSLAILSGEQLEALFKRHSAHPREIVDQAKVIVKESGLSR